MPTSGLMGHAFGGTLALPARLRFGWLARHADAITDTLGQPLFKFGRYGGGACGLPQRKRFFAHSLRNLCTPDRALRIQHPNSPIIYAFIFMGLFNEEFSAESRRTVC